MIYFVLYNFSLEFASIIHSVHEISMFEKGRNTESIVLRFRFQAYHLSKIFFIYSMPNKYRIRITVKGKKQKIQHTIGAAYVPSEVKYQTTSSYTYRQYPLLLLIYCSFSFNSLSTGIEGASCTTVTNRGVSVLTLIFVFETVILAQTWPTYLTALLASVVWPKIIFSGNDWKLSKDTRPD